MNYSASAFQDESSSFAELTLASLFDPIADELEQTQALYQETVLQTAESSYIHRLVSGDGFSFIPQEFRVPLADQIAGHLLKSEGKWIRSALVLLVADACGLRDLRVRQVAVAVEMLHLATLVHDDIIDEAPVRRGVQTVSNGWGNKIAVLLGDFLLSKAFKLLLSSGSIPTQKLLTRSTGQMVLGEIKQLCIQQQDEVSELEYLETIENKTASLMAAAAASGAYLAELPETLVEKAHGYGHSLGMAFQISDDVLDYTSNTNTLGKELGIDLKNGKSTLPLIHLMKHKRDQALSILSGNGPIEDKTKKLVTLMHENGSVAYAYSVGHQFGQIARKNLEALEATFGVSASLSSLMGLVDFVLSREK